MSNSYLRAAFQKICNRAIQSSDVVAFQEFLDEETANRAATRCYKMAKILERSAEREFSLQCVRETAWLDARGLEDFFLPEVDGPTKYRVVVGEGIPKESRGSRHYE